MTPYVEPGGKSLIFDLTFRHIGRIKKASGTMDEQELAAIKQAFRDIAKLDPPRYDILRATQDGTYTPREVWIAFRRQRLDSLISSKQTRAPLFEHMQGWIDSYQCSDKHRISLNQSLRYLKKYGRKRAPIEELPRILETFRTEMNKLQQGRTFNITRSAAQAYVRSTLKRNHPLYLQLSAIEVLPVIKTREGNPQTPDELRELMKKLSPAHAAHAWSMAVASMGPDEYWGKWDIQSDRVRIHGTKRAGRDRFVPLVDPTITRPTTNYRAFQKALVKASGGAVKPYDMRRSFSTWMEECGISRTRRRIYMGHGKKDVLDLYETKDIRRFLAEDSNRLRKHVGIKDRQPLTLVKGGTTK